MTPSVPSNASQVPSGVPADPTEGHFRHRQGEAFGLTKGLGQHIASCGCSVIPMADPGTTTEVVSAELFDAATTMADPG